MAAPQSRSGIVHFRETSWAARYIGISFFRNLDRSLVLTSVAQVFNERGEGVVVCGGPAQVSKEDRNVHLLEADARGGPGLSGQKAELLR